MNAPGTCVDCGNEAYIRLAGEQESMICAHCFAVRHPAERPSAAKAPRREPAAVKEPRRELSRLRLQSPRADVR